MHPENPSGADPRYLAPTLGPQADAGNPLENGQLQTAVPEWPALTPYPSEHPDRKRKRRWIALGAAGLAMLCVGTAGLAVFGTTALREPTAAPGVTPEGSPSPTPARSPEAGDSHLVVKAWVQERIADGLARQREALLAGDEAAYLAVLSEDAGKATRTALARQFRSLQAMQVAQWRDEVTGLPAEWAADEKWQVEVRSTPCFVTVWCADADVLTDTKWKIEDGVARLTDSEPDSEPLPWQVSELVAKSGERTVVATTKNHASRLDDLVAKAETAARIADRFARGDKIPYRYVVYFAGDREWDTWFGGGLPDWSGGYATAVSKDRWEMVLNAKDLHRTFLDDILRHELTHTASLTGSHRDDGDVWWLIEGIAEHAEMEGTPARRYPLLWAVGDLVAANKVSSVQVRPAGRSMDDDEVSGRYGAAFLGVRCIVEQYGEDDMTEFFHNVLHDRMTFSDASEAALGETWAVVSSECYSYLKDHAR